MRVTVVGGDKKDDRARNNCPGCGSFFKAPIALARSRAFRRQLMKREHLQTLDVGWDAEPERGRYPAAAHRAETRPWNVPTPCSGHALRPGTGRAPGGPSFGSVDAGRGADVEVRGFGRSNRMSAWFLRQTAGPLS